LHADRKQSGILLIVSGPSGVGKSTVCRQVAGQLDAFLSVSITTRPHREGEKDGQDYRFISTEEFQRLIEQGSVLEYACVYGGQYYGTPAEPVVEALDAGRVVILEIEIEGTLQVKRRFPDAIAVYMLAPTSDEQRNRIVGRQQDSAQAVTERLGKADDEILNARDCGAYTHFLVNADIEETVEQLVRIVQEKQQT